MMPEKISSEHFLLGPLSLRNSQLSQDWKCLDCKTELFWIIHDKISFCTCHDQRKITSFKLNIQDIIKDLSFLLVVQSYGGFYIV